MPRDGVERAVREGRLGPGDRTAAARAGLAAEAQWGERAELARLQRGLQELLLTPGDPGRVDEAAARALGVSAEQTRVYRGMIALRFAREVAREFPATRALLGCARFESESRGFAARTASHSYTLEGYARRFPEHLRGSQDAALRAAAPLARLERELAWVRCAAHREPVGERAGSAGAEVVPGHAPQLEAAPAARIRCFAWDVELAYTAFERGELPALPSHAPPARGGIRLALFRAAGRVVRLRVTPREAPLLSALLRGQPLAGAVARGVLSGLAPDEVREALARWVGARLLVPARGRPRRDSAGAEAQPDRAAAQ